jgi:hypothetical protein
MEPPATSGIQACVVTGEVKSRHIINPKDSSWAGVSAKAQVEIINEKHKKSRGIVFLSK